MPVPISIIVFHNDAIILVQYWCNNDDRRIKELITRAKQCKVKVRSRKYLAMPMYRLEASLQIAVAEGCMVAGEEGVPGGGGDDGGCSKNTNEGKG